MLGWDGLDLALALWTPLLVAWTALAAWGLLVPHDAWRSSLDGHAHVPRVPVPPLAATASTPASTSALHGMLQTADERAAAYLEVLTQHPADPARIERRRGALELTTLVALLMVRDWAARMDREPIGPHAAPVVDSIRTRTGEALLTLFASPPRSEALEGGAARGAGAWPRSISLHVHALHARRLREHLAELGSDLRTFQQAYRATGQDPYR